MFSVGSEQRHYGRGENGKNGVSIVFHEKIGAHDIVIVMASNSSELVSWISNFWKTTMLLKIFLLDAFEPMIMNYMARGFQNYVVDTITVPRNTSVEPILYWFEKSFLYYPPVITTPLGGYIQAAPCSFSPKRMFERFLQRSIPLSISKRHIPSIALTILQMSWFYPVERC